VDNGSSVTAHDQELREREFWDEHVPELAACVREYREGPDPNSAVALDSLEPLEGRAVLDVACGVGVTSCWLADRGAVVTEVDLSPRAIERARDLAKELQLTATFAVGAFETGRTSATYDRVFGRYALHHMDCAEVAPILASQLSTDGSGAFVETTSSNPFLRFARDHIAGRYGIPRIGTPDEHPLTRHDLDVIEAAFGFLRLDVAQMQFLRIFNRQVLRYRVPLLTRGLGMLDDLILRAFRWRSGSYHQVVLVRRPAGGAGA
jgi:protein-L-isoaspartate O-methyltransferase